MSTGVASIDLHLSVLFDCIDVLSLLLLLSLPPHRSTTRCAPLQSAWQLLDQLKPDAWPATLCNSKSNHLSIWSFPLSQLVDDFVRRNWLNLYIFDQLSTWLFVLLSRFFCVLVFCQNIVNSFESFWDFTSCWQVQQLLPVVDSFGSFYQQFTALKMLLAVDSFGCF